MGCCVRWSVIGAAAILIVLVKTASAQPAPIVIEADIITYDAVEQVTTAEGNVRATFRRYRLFADAARMDLRSGVLTATGRIRLIDQEGREVRAQTLMYNTRTEEGFVERLEGRFERRVFVRGDRLELSPRRLVLSDATATTCDPQRPLYRIAARRIEVTPGEELVAHDASVFLGGTRLFTVPRLRLSLRPADPGPRLPAVGANEIDGYWIDYRFPVQVAGGAGDLHVKYGTLSGPFALLRLTHEFPGYRLHTRLGRTQTDGERQSGNLLPYDVAEVSAVTRPARLGSLPLTWSLYGAAGWFSERQTGVATTRVDAELSVTPDPIPLSPRLSLSTRGAYRISSYGIGSQRTITTLWAAFSYTLDPLTTLEIGYSYADVQGGTPLNLDVVDPSRTFFVGGTHAVVDRYRVSAFAFFNAVVPETTTKVSVGLVVARNLEVGVFADYNFRTSAFAELNYAIRYICDCIEIAVRYRTIQREFSIELGLTGFGGTTPLVPRTPPPEFPQQP